MTITGNQISDLSYIGEGQYMNGSGGILLYFTKNETVDRIQISGNKLDKIDQPVLLSDLNPSGNNKEKVVLRENTIINPVLPVTLNGFAWYGTIEDALDDATDGDTVTLYDDIQLDKRLTINKDKGGVTLDLGGKTITASDDFKGEGNDAQLVTVIGAEGVTIKNGSLVATDKNKHTLNVYNATGLTLQNLTLNHSAAFSGAPLVIGGSSVVERVIWSLSPARVLVRGNLDPNTQESVSFKLEDGGSIVHRDEGSATTKDLFVIDGISGVDPDTGSAIENKDATITFGTGTSVTPSAPDAAVVVQQEYKEQNQQPESTPVGDGVVSGAENAGLIRNADGTYGAAPAAPVQPNRTPSYNKAPADWYNDKYDETEPDVILSENGIYLQARPALQRRKSPCRRTSWRKCWSPRMNWYWKTREAWK